MKVEDIMTRQPICIDENEMLQNAIAVMLQHRISGLPVVDGKGRPVGMLTEADLLRRTETQTERKRSRWLEYLVGASKLAEEYVHTHGRRVKEVMSTPLISASPDIPLEAVVRLMEKHRIKRVAVIRDDKLVGILSRANLVHALAAVIQDIPPAAPSDDAILQAIWQELDNTHWAPKGALDIIVRNGVVHINGVVMIAEEINALTVAAENIPGVKEVRNNVAWCDPMSGLVIENDLAADPAARARNNIQNVV